MAIESISRCAMIWSNNCLVSLSTINQRFRIVYQYFDRNLEDLKYAEIYQYV